MPTKIMNMSALCLLIDALANKFYSIAVDILLKEGELVVAHNLGEFKGSVHSNGVEFWFWLDIQDSKPKLLETLHNNLL